MKDHDFDSPEWRERRDDKLMEWFGDINAVELFIDLSSISEFYDDLVDADAELTYGEAVNVLRASMVDIQENPFYQENEHWIRPFLDMSIRQWLYANHIEREGGNLELAYVLRMLLMLLAPEFVKHLRGQKAADEVVPQAWAMACGGETFEEYLSDLEARPVPE